MADAMAKVRNMPISYARSAGVRMPEAEVLAAATALSRCTRLLLAGAFALASCATIDATTTPYVGVLHAPPTDPAKVQILRTEPKRAHERLGEIVVDASTDPAPPITQVEEKLRVEGGKLGADAVVVVLDRIQPIGAYVSGPRWNATLEPITGRKLVGVAIKYQP